MGRPAAADDSRPRLKYWPQEHSVLYVLRGRDRLGASGQTRLDTRRETALPRSGRHRTRAAVLTEVSDSFVGNIRQPPPPLFLALIRRLRQPASPRATPPNLCYSAPVCLLQTGLGLPFVVADVICACMKQLFVYGRKYLPLKRPTLEQERKRAALCSNHHTQNQAETGSFDRVLSTGNRQVAEPSSF